VEELIEVDMAGNYFDAWLSDTVAGSPSTVRNSVEGMGKWVMLSSSGQPGGVPLDLGKGCGRSADWQGVSDYILEKFAPGWVIVEDRLSLAADSDVVTVEDVGDGVRPGISSVDLQVSIFSVLLADGTKNLHSLLSGMSHWQFPVALVFDKSYDLPAIRDGMIGGSCPSASAAIVSCCDGENVVAGYASTVGKFN